MSAEDDRREARELEQLELLIFVVASIAVAITFLLSAKSELRQFSERIATALEALLALLKEKTP